MHEIDLELKLQLQGKHKEAREISDRLESIGSDKILDNNGKNTQDIWFRHCFNRGWFKIQEGDYQAGCKLLEHGRYLSVYGSPPLKTNAPIYNPEVHSIKDKSIIISLEGGYGDEIIHARFANEYKKQGAKAVYLAAAPELVSIFSRIEGVDKVILRDAAETVEHDYWVPGFSAGWVAGLTFDNFPSQPYLSPNPMSVNIWKSIIKNDKVKVGIRWAGNPKFEHQQFRRFPTEFITNLKKYKELEIYSFQKDHNLINLPEGVHDLQHFLLSWEDTMAAIANIDIMITSCTSMAHIAAAMGKETWVLVPILPYHTWTPGAPESRTSPYYNCVQIFRQTKPNKWNDTFQLLYKELEEKFNLEHVEMPDEDKVKKRINLGCGFNKFDGCLNVDKSEFVKPDDVVDLNVFPWKWKDNEFSHVVAKDILEHLGDKPEDFIKIIKEMYRISDNGAVWEVIVPHWRCDTALDDPTHKRLITLGMFKLFDKRLVLEGLKNDKKVSNSLIAFEEDIDIEVCDIDFQYTPPYEKRIKAGVISKEELNHSLNHLNNVALSMKLLIQVFKPARYDLNDLNNVI
jgi:hypothetical protein